MKYPLWFQRIAVRLIFWHRRRGNLYRCVQCGEERYSYRWYRKHRKAGNCPLEATRLGRKRAKRWHKKRAKKVGNGKR